MPDYEYLCRTCGKQFTAHMSLKEHETRPAECPECKSAAAVEPVLSHFNVQTTKKSSAYR
ncbi:MAG TPA: FmdB family zinc ribbon protein [Myxococcaceae bacterium]|nr:FmdB family zinc ribbon protein [Myxococcaceae bacterium]